MADVMEIGVFEGRSLMMWAEYFRAAHVLGVDHFTGIQGTGSRQGPRNPIEKVLAGIRRWDADPGNGPGRIALHTADQANASILHRLVSSLGSRRFDGSARISRLISSTHSFFSSPSFARVGFTSSRT